MTLGWQCGQTRESSGEIWWPCFRNGIKTMRLTAVVAESGAIGRKIARTTKRPDEFETSRDAPIRRRLAADTSLVSWGQRRLAGSSAALRPAAHGERRLHTLILSAADGLGSAPGHAPVAGDPTELATENHQSRGRMLLQASGISSRIRREPDGRSTNAADRSSQREVAEKRIIDTLVPRAKLQLSEVGGAAEGTRTPDPIITNFAVHVLDATR